MKTGPKIVTFGCRLNAFESEVMRDRAADLSDAIIFNTCAVTKEAERQARQAIRRARRDNPSKKIIVSGCAAQVSAETFAAMPEVDQVIGNAEKLTEDAYRSNARVLVGDIMTVRETAGHLIEGFEGRARAFVQVQQGCDHRCTFCIIPFGRGPNRSVPVGEVVRQVQTLVENGFNEIVLTGVDITDYGADLPGKPKLGSLARRLLNQVPDLPRLRLSSLDPMEIDDELLDLIAGEERLLPYFHMSLQAGDDMILKRMKRRHLRGDAIAMCDRIRTLRPDAVFGADLIAGFPTETEEMFANSLAIIEECDLTHLHVFPYSIREGTPAANMPHIEVKERRARAKRLREAGSLRMQNLLESRVGKFAEILVEKDNTGRCERYLPVKLDSEAAPGALVRARITGRDGDKLTAQKLTAITI